ncbi:hypothetical protein NQ315_010067 [Exocentrus adspersus]|uniref:RNase H type-1 domain-containing protein n=1 Tax=Exocentrus adspersus TaxID=1586481 RepID=A0AAV8WAK2_9CUCU|nr:hypothetical protein NQ315_010067 [Exocentrus adspersus]
MKRSHDEKGRRESGGSQGEGQNQSLFLGDALESLARQKEVGLVWVPGHTVIPGNERADQLARLRSEEPEPILGISRGGINGALNKWTYEKIRNEFEDEYRIQTVP